MRVIKYAIHSSPLGTSEPPAPPTRTPDTDRNTSPAADVAVVAAPPAKDVIVPIIPPTVFVVLAGGEPLSVIV